MAFVARFHGAVDGVGGVDGGYGGEGAGQVFFSFDLSGAALVFGGGADVGRGFGGAVVVAVFVVFVVWVISAAVAIAAHFASVVASCDLGIVASVTASAVAVTVLDVGGWLVASWSAIVIVACCC